MIKSLFNKNKKESNAVKEEKIRSKLESVVDYKIIPSLPYKDIWILCKVVDVYDGDTVTIVYVDQYEMRKTKIRVIGIDAAEMNSKCELEKKAAVVTKNVVSGLILGKIVEVKMLKHDMYGGRIDGDIRFNYNDIRTTSSDSSSSSSSSSMALLLLSEYLLQKQLVHPYDGKTKKKPFTKDELQRIVNFSSENKQ